MPHHSATLNQGLQYDRQIAYWLFFSAAVIFGMILLGGVTRLTNSGLSMVDWKPIMGVIPPLTEADWQGMFLKYQQFPEYQKINLGMSLEEFKYIFMYEYLHRVLGRLIGIIFIVPFLFLLHQTNQSRPHPQAVNHVDRRGFSGIARLVHGKKWPGR